MKAFFAITLAFHAVSAQQSWIEKIRKADESLSEKNITTELATDFIEGYIDGLMNIYIRGELKDCQTLVPDAQEHI